MLNILQCIGQTPIAKKYPAQNANNAIVEDPALSLIQAQSLLLQEI